MSRVNQGQDKSLDRKAVLREALTRIEELQGQLEVAQGTSRGPIAVIGMACRFPGGATDPQSYWQLLQNRVDAVREVPADRWDAEEFYDPDPKTRGKTYSRWGGYLDRVDEFDAEFFGIPPREAATLDPQHRLVLEVTWEALENAGLAPTALAGSQTGVFVGITISEYLQLIHKSLVLENLDAYQASGNTLNAAAGRVSYFLGLNGPTMALDTACSSSLVGVHLASQSLRTGDCDLALAGGVNVLLVPETYISFSQWGMLSPTGRCRTFDASADGFVRSEGCGFVVLKRLEDALAHGDQVLAVIRGSAVNQDGASSGLSVPSGLAQEKVIRQGLANAGVEPHEVGFIETHGTGTTLGDPIEAEALGAVFSRDSKRKSPLVLGAVKSNLGHLESASGVAGLIKTILVLQHGEIPANLHLDQASPRIPWADLPFHLPRESQSWPAGDVPRIAGVSSFGFSGTNAHIVLAEAPTPPLPVTDEDSRSQILCLSAKSEAGLRDVASRFADRLAEPGEPSWADVCFSANTGRSHLPRRLAVVAEDREEARSILVGKSAASTGEVIPEKPLKKVVFLFSGQGAQYGGMGRELYDSEPVFRQALDECAASLDEALGVPLLKVIHAEPDDPRLHETRFTQPALFALEYSLARMWQSWGVEPAALLGHSVGEYVAACLAGVFNLEDGLRLISERARLMQELPRDGAMAAVFADEETVISALEGLQDRVSIAAINGPRNVVISGKSETVNEVREALAGNKVRSKPLRVSHAFHSALMEPMLDEFTAIAAQVQLNPPQKKLYTNLTGRRATADQVTRAQHWSDHVRQAVRFADAVAELRSEGFQLFLEIGPGTTLLQMGRAASPTGFGTWVPSLRKGRPAWPRVLESLGELYTRGLDVDWEGFYRSSERARVEVPNYPFQRRRYWFSDSAGEGIGIPGSHTTSVLREINEGDTESLLRRVSDNLDDEGRRAATEVLAAIVEAHRNEMQAEPVDRSLYELEWHEKPRAGRAQVSEQTSDRWIVLADGVGVGYQLAEKIRGLGGTCLLVEAGSELRSDGDHHWFIRPSEPADYRRLLAEVAADDPSRLRIIHCWNLDAASMSLAEQMPAHTLGAASILFMLQALVAHEDKPRAEMWVVTRGAVDVQGLPTEAALLQAPAWGLGRVATLEHPEVWGGLVDLEAGEEGDGLDRLLAEVLDPDGEDQIALRGERRFVPRLVRSQIRSAAKARFDSAGTYLVTGGLGGLGLEVTRWLVEHGARSLVLTGRRGAATEAAQKLVRDLEEQDVSLRVAKVDVTDVVAMKELMGEIARSMPPLRGILHAAGLGGYDELSSISPELFESLMMAKTTGTWNLHSLTLDLDLDLFVCFSSIASLWGSAGQAHYAAANHFLDVFCHFRRAQGKSAVSVNWGPWAAGGMATEDFLDKMSRLGVRGLTPTQALTALGRIIRSDRAQVAVANVDWHAFKAIFEVRGHRPLLDLIDGGRDRPGEASHEVSELMERLAAARPDQRQDLLVRHIQSVVSQVLGLAGGESVAPHLGFFDLGMDSLMAVDLKERLEQSLGCELPTTLAFDYPTIDDVAGFLAAEVAQIGEVETAESQATVPTDPGLVEEIKTLSEAELAELIDDEIRGLE